MFISFMKTSMLLHIVLQSSRRPNLAAKRQPISFLSHLLHHGITTLHTKYIFPCVSHSLCTCCYGLAFNVHCLGHYISYSARTAVSTPKLHYFSAIFVTKSNVPSKSLLNTKETGPTRDGWGGNGGHRGE